MRILVIGGTAFVGRHIVAAAIDAGHDVTMFNRGLTGSELFPDATHLTGDRNVDLAALASGSWDATVDVCAYFPRQVRSLALALDGRGGPYTFISSVSAYSPTMQPNYDESAALATVDDPEATEVTDENYGGLKAVCEQESALLFGPDTTIIRPTYVIGPYDRSYRFTWWVDRVAMGGTVLVPGDPDDPIQLIDARDQAAFVVSLLERSSTGTFHTVNPAPPFGFGQMVETIAAEVAPPGTRLMWVSSDFLISHGVDGAALPLWPVGERDAVNMSRASPAAAFAAGLAPRPLRETVADIRAEDRVPGTGRPGIGLLPQREAELLAGWAAASG
jgi:2'-hydroxyisoflavone reductase